MVEIKKKLTKKELLHELKGCANFIDEENAHCEADNLLLRYIDDEEISLAFKDITRWYG